VREGRKGEVGMELRGGNLSREFARMYLRKLRDVLAKTKGCTGEKLRSYLRRLKTMQGSFVEKEASI